MASRGWRIRWRPPRSSLEHVLSGERSAVEAVFRALSSATERGRVLMVLDPEGNTVRNAMHGVWKAEQP